MWRLVVVLAFAGLAQPIVLVEREPMHRVVFENELVRVIDAAVAPGRATAYHTHERDNVPVAVAAGETTTTPLGGTPVRSPVALGRVSYARGGYTHEVRNSGSTPLRFIDVELRGPRGTPTGGQFDSSRHVKEIDNERVVVHRLRVPAGARVGGHHHAGPLLEVVVRGDRVARGDSAPAAAVAGAFAWRAEGRVPRIENDAAVEFELVEVEWKP